MGSVNVALLHHPVYNKRKDVVTTCITGFDLHDIARSAATFGVKKYFVVNPLPAQIKFAERIIDCWRSEQSFVHNWTRAEAFSLMELKKSLEEVLSELKNPIVVATSAKEQVGERKRKVISYKKLRDKIKKSKRPFLLLFGTGWGMTEELIDKADLILPPVNGSGEYNHLSVRGAVAIILDRLLGK